MDSELLITQTRVYNCSFGCGQRWGGPRQEPPWERQGPVKHAMMCDTAKAFDLKSENLIGLCKYTHGFFRLMAEAPLYLRNHHLEAINLNLLYCMSKRFLCMSSSTTTVACPISCYQIHCSLNEPLLPIKVCFYHYSFFLINKHVSHDRFPS